MKKKSKLGLVVNTVFCIVFAIVLIIVVMMMFSRAKGEVFFVGDRSYIWVMTNSMADEIPEKTYICIRREAPENVEVGDVITFFSDDPSLGGNLNTHRVVDVIGDGEEFVTKGDNNPINDKYTAKGDKLVGVYEKNSALLTWCGRIFQSRVGILAVIGIIAIITFFALFYDILPKKRKDGQPSDEAK